MEVHKEPIYMNSMYTVSAGPSMLLDGAIVYLCINNLTGVVEAEEQMLPRIIEYADQLEKKVGEMLEAGYEIYPVEGKKSLPLDPSIH